MVRRLGKKPEDFFLTRAMTRQKFAKIEEWGERFTIFGTPVYQEFLAGKRELTCTAWAIPTFNVRGWKAPCYLMTDGHYDGYQEMLAKVQWDKYGVVNGVARDPRCGEALDLLESKRLPDGGFPLEKRNFVRADRIVTRGSFGDWGPSGRTRSNAFVTADALERFTVLRRATVRLLECASDDDLALCRAAAGRRARAGPGRGLLTTGRRGPPG